MKIALVLAGSLAALLLVGVGPAFSQTSGAARDSVSEATELQLLRQQVLLLEQYADRQLETTRSATNAVSTLVAGALTLFTIVAGLNFFQNRMRQTEMERELKELVRREADSLRSINTALFSESRQMLESELTSKFSREARLLNTKIDELKFASLIAEQEARLKSGSYTAQHTFYTTTLALGMTEEAPSGDLARSQVLSLIRKVLDDRPSEVAELKSHYVTDLLTALSQQKGDFEECSVVKARITRIREAHK